MKTIRIVDAQRQSRDCQLSPYELRARSPPFLLVLGAAIQHRSSFCSCVLIASSNASPGISRE